MVQIKPLSDILPSPKNIRIKFRKVGKLQYIGHLDLVRTMTRALLRAHMPVWYSEGFNPRPKLNFATPMSVGAQSEYELLDIRVNREVEPQEVVSALNANLPSELKVLSAYYPNTRFSDIAYSSYKIIIVTQGATQELSSMCERCLNSVPITVFKRSKSGDRDVDISPYIYNAKAKFTDGTVVIDCILKADNADFLNPEYLITYLKREANILSGSPLFEHYDIIRTGLYFADMRPFE